MSEATLDFADAARLAEVDAPDLVATLTALLDQPEPEPVPGQTDGITLEVLRRQLADAAKRFQKEERRAQAHAAWKKYLAQGPDRVHPQIRVAELVEALYAKRTGPARIALLEIASRAPLVYGIWGGLKRVYKRAETDHDAEVFGALAVRFDVEARGYASERRDVQRGTLVYLQRRAWRYLRLLGKATPELYPQFAVEVLRRYPLGTHPYQVAIFGRIEHHHAAKWGAPQGLARDKKFRATYLEAWQRSPDPLMLLLETCQADIAASFAITGLRELFPDVLRNPTPQFLARLALRPLAAAHAFLVETLEGSPAFHQSKLKSLGLHEAVLALLASPEKRARKYAIDYARSHASDLPVDRLLALLERESELDDTAKFVLSLLTARGARALGVEAVGRLVAFQTTRKWAETALESEFDRKEISDAFLVDMLLAEDSRRPTWTQGYIDKKLGAATLPLAFWLRLLDDPRFREDRWSLRAIATWAAKNLVKNVPISAAPADWVLGALARPEIADPITEWLEKAEALPAGIDIERIKGLVFDPARRVVAFKLLGNKKLVSPGEVGLGWLLALARRADPQLHEWAHRYLLQHMRPEHFAEGKPDAKRGTARLFELALGAREPEAVRTFAQTFLRCHHPKIGKEQPETKQFGVKSAIGRDAYTAERIWPALFDQRVDVRRFAVAITRVELRRWNAQSRIYELAESSAKEVRRIAYDALAQAGETYADPDLALTPDELDAAEIFSMTESRIRGSRDVAIELIRKHYARIGGAERLGWLMQSADREVRFFAVKLLWERHRPRGLPAGYEPRGGARAKSPLASSTPFTDVDALRDFLRRLLFTIPPGRSMESLEGSTRAKKVPTGLAKKNLVEIVRDLAITDAAFAGVVAPVLAAHTGSKAKGEWQACLAALVTLRGIHGLAIEGMV